MAPPEAKIEMVVVAMNLQNGCTEISVPGCLTREASTVAPLAAVFQRTKRAEVHRNRPASNAKSVNPLSPDVIS